MLDDGMDDLLDELKYSVYGSFLEDVDELNLKVWYEETIKESVMATVLFRCGFEPDETLILIFLSCIISIHRKLSYN